MVRAVSRPEPILLERYAAMCMSLGSLGPSCFIACNSYIIYYKVRRIKSIVGRGTRKLRKNGYCISRIHGMIQNK